MTTDPFAAPDNDPDPDRRRPEVMSGYDGECGVCGLDYFAGDRIRATADGAGWEPVEHDHDPEDSTPIDSVPVEMGSRVVLDAPPQGLYADPSPDQFSCPECPKTFAPTKDRLVRTHKALATGERCPGSRAVPVELVEDAVANLGEPGEAGREALAVLDASAATVLVLEPGTVLAAAVAGSPQVAAIVDRINGGRTGMFTPSPEARDLLAGDDRGDPIDAGAQPDPWQGPAAPEPSLGDLYAALGSGHDDVVAEAERLLGGDGDDPAEAMYRKVNGLVAAAPPEDAPDAAHDDYDKRLEQQFPANLPAVPEPVHTIATMAPGTVAVAEEGYRPAEPEPERDSYGRYLLPHPVTGKGQSWRRATTFAGALDDTYNLDMWQKRHLVVGLTLRPDLLASATGLRVEQRTKSLLNEIAEQAAEESGVHEAAEQGTYVHALTEEIDRSADAAQRNAAWLNVPDHYRADVTAYGRALDQAGLRVVPSMLERRTAVVEFGVAGTFDQLLQLTRDIPGVGRAGEYVVGDKKTGSDMSYGQGTHSIQLALYAHGLNSAGVWDGHTRTWVPSVPVREDVGIIIHIPLQGGDCTLHVLDLTVGWAAAQLAHRVYNFRSVAKAKGAKSISRVLHTVHVDPYRAPEAPAVQQIAQAPQAAPAAELTPQQIDHWAGRGRSVRTTADAAAVFGEMVAAGLTEQQRGKMVAFMNQVLDGEVADAGPQAPADPLSVAYWTPRAQGVMTKQEASALFQEMSAAGVPQDALSELVGVMTTWLESNADAPGPVPAAAVTAPSVPSGTDVLSAAYWTPIAMGVTTRQEASGVFGAMTAAGVHDDVKAAMVQRMTDWLASQAQADAALGAVVRTALGVPVKADDWEARAGQVLVREQASTLYREAQAAPGMTAERLSELVGMMNASLDNEPPF